MPPTRLFVALLLLMLAPAHGQSNAVISTNAPRLALVIGNARYNQVETLNNPVNDARLIAWVLSDKLGFEVTLGENLDRREMLTFIAKFAAAIRTQGPQSVSFVFYAGHGVEQNGTNLILPIDVDFDSPEQVSRIGISVEEMIAPIVGAKNQLNIVVLDTCRDNPFGAEGRPFQGKGLSPMGSVFGILIASSTGAGDIAYDGPGANSPYTTALAESLVTPGKVLEEVFKSVRRRVRLATHNKQIPWESSSLEREFFLLPLPERNPAAVAMQVLHFARSIEFADRVASRFAGSLEGKEAARVANMRRAAEANGSVSRQAALQYELGVRLRNTTILEQIADLHAGAELETRAKTEISRFTAQGTVVTKGGERSISLVEQAFRFAQQKNSVDAFELVKRLFPDSARAAEANGIVQSLRVAENSRLAAAAGQLLLAYGEEMNFPEALELLVDLLPETPSVGRARLIAQRLRTRQIDVSMERPLYGVELIAKIQRELQRVGCEDVALTERFDASTVGALRAFAQLTDEKFYWHKPTMAALRALRHSQGGTGCAPQIKPEPAECLTIAGERLCE